MRWTPFLILLPLGLGAAACATGDAAGGGTHAAVAEARLEPYECGSISRIHVFGDVFLAGQPAPEDFEHARDGGIRTVVNLRHEEEIGFDERAVVESLGLNYINIPFKAPEELTDAVFDRMRELLNQAERPILVHCSSANRVGAVWIPWRVLDQGASLEEAVLEARTIGLRSPVYEQKARDYVASRLGGS